MKTQILADYVEALTSAQSLDECFSAFDISIQKTGFQGVAYSFIPRLSIQADGKYPPVFKFSNSYDPKFIAEYAERRFDKDDFTIKAIQNGQMRVLDWWEEDDKNRLSKSEREVIGVAKFNYKINNGISIPTMSDERGIAGASIITDDYGKRFEYLKNEQLNTAIQLTRLFHNAVLANPEFSHAFVLPIVQSLTNTEKRILRYLVSGKPMKNVEDYTGVSYRYATKVADGLREKFGNISSKNFAYYVGLANLVEYI